MLTLTAIPALQDNYIWLLHNRAGQALVVDPGDAQPVLSMASEGIEPVAILLTHHHADHISGANALRQRFDIPVYAPKDERITCATDTVGDGDLFNISALNVTAQVIAVPGHTLSHIAFVIDDYLFCGDTLFSLGCGRLFEGTPAQMLGSLERLACLPAHSKVCCGHEYTLANAAFARCVEPKNPERELWLEHVCELRKAGLPSLPSTIAIERACNPFLRADVPAVVNAVANQIARIPDHRIETFAALRQWKDGFVV